MDSQEKDQLVDDQLAKLKEALQKIKTEDLTISSDADYTPTIDFDSMLDSISTIDMSGLTYSHTSSPTITISGAGSGTTSNTMWATSQTSLYTQPSINPNSGKIHITGENPDIMLGDVSLMGVLGTLQERLNVLVPNPALEKEWEELKELGDQYRELEKLLKERAYMWAQLSKKDSN